MQYDLRNNVASANEAWLRILRAVLERGQRVGSRDGAAIELLNASFTLTSLDRTLVTLPLRGIDPAYAAAETLWYLSGQDRIEMIRAYAPQYERFAENGRAWGGYGRRLQGSDLFAQQLHVTQRHEAPWAASQITAVAETLRQKPESRQAIISFWNDGDLPHAVLGDKKDLPCTVAMQFFIRQARLHLTVTMRSNDIWLGLPYDVFAFTAIQRVVAALVGCRSGTYHHQVGSMHLYERDEAKARAGGQYGDPVRGPDLEAAHDWRWPGSLEPKSHIKEALTFEHLIRTNEFNAVDAIAFAGHGTPVSDLVAAAAWRHGTRLEPRSAQLRLALERKYHDRDRGTGPGGKDDAVQAAGAGAVQA